jgi:hypothetical protein
MQWSQVGEDAVNLGKHVLLAVLACSVVACDESPTTPNRTTPDGTYAGPVQGATGLQGSLRVTLQSTSPDPVTGYNVSGTWSGMFPKSPSASGSVDAGLATLPRVQLELLQSDGTCAWLLDLTCAGHLLSGSYEGCNKDYGTVGLTRQ